MNSEYKKVRDDLEYYFQLDVDNCRMTNLDWINVIALLITNNDYKYNLLDEINEYIWLNKIKEQENNYE